MICSNFSEALFTVAWAEAPEEAVKMKMANQRMIPFKKPIS
jgi:hypothetical protein